MRTAKFIFLQFQNEIERIKQECEDIVPALSAEEEILLLQEKQKIHNGITVVGSKISQVTLTLHFNTGGGIFFQIYLGRSMKSGYLLSRYPGAKWETLVRPYGENSPHVEDLLWQIPLRDLKKIHPKTFAEYLRFAGKKFLM